MYVTDKLETVCEFLEMGIYVFYCIALFSIIAANGQTAASRVCWDSTWFNISASTKADISEYEQLLQSSQILDSVCYKGPAIAARCKEGKGEPFQGFRNDSVAKYVARCDVIIGLVCNPYKTSNELCPDFKIQYGCTCLKALYRKLSRHARGGSPTTSIHEAPPSTSKTAQPTYPSTKSTYKSTTINSGGITTPANAIVGGCGGNVGNGNSGGTGSGSTGSGNAGVSTTSGTGTASQQRRNGGQRFSASYILLITSIVLEYLRNKG